MSTTERTGRPAPADRQLGTYAALGRALTLRCDEPRLHRLLHHLLAPLQVPGADHGTAVTFDLRTDRDGRLTTTRDGEPLGGARPAERSLGRIIWAINRHVIDGAMVDRLVFHAAAAADPDGRVVVLPAPMESGKTTLVTGLLDRGLHYLTDEAAALDDDLTVHGYAKPLSIDPGSWDVLAHHRPALEDDLAAFMTDQWQVPPHTFTTVVPSGRLAVVVFPTYAVDAPTTLTRLSPMDALDLARASAFGPADTPHPVWKIRRLAEMVETVPCFALRSGDLDGACAAVLDVLADPSA